MKISSLGHYPSPGKQEKSLLGEVSHLLEGKAQLLSPTSQPANAVKERPDMVLGTPWTLGQSLTLSLGFGFIIYKMHGGLARSDQ